jgi:hypothetical protein
MWWSKLISDSIQIFYVNPSIKRRKYELKCRREVQSGILIVLYNCLPDRAHSADNNPSAIQQVIPHV